MRSSGPVYESISSQTEGGGQVTREEFSNKMFRAGTMIEIGEDQDYWAGYRRGLRRRFHGDLFGIRGMHQQLLSQSESRDLAIAEFSRGYREGFSSSDG